MSSSDWLARIQDRMPTEQEVRDMLSGHLCRCTGYTPIVMAVTEVARSRYAKRNQNLSTLLNNKESSHA